MKDFLHKITSDQQRKYLKHLLGYLRLLVFWSVNPKTKFIIFTQSRCGSGLLATLLGNHPDILIDGEIFNANRHFKVSSLRLYLSSRGRMARLQNKSVYGFKLKLHHLTDHHGLSMEQAKSFISSLNDKGWRVVYLRRNNFLRRSLSSLAAQKRGVRHIQGDANKLQKIHVNSDTLLNRIKVSEQRVELDQKILEQIPYLLIEYENDLLDQSQHAQTCRKIFDFLQIPPVEVQTRLTRTSTDDLSKTIDNYEEIRKVLEKTKYADLLTSR